MIFHIWVKDLGPVAAIANENTKSSYWTFDNGIIYDGAVAVACRTNINSGFDGFGYIQAVQQGIVCSPHKDTITDGACDGNIIQGYIVAEGNHCSLAGIEV